MRAAPWGWVCVGRGGERGAHEPHDMVASRPSPPHTPSPKPPRTPSPPPPSGDHDAGAAHGLWRGDRGAIAAATRVSVSVDVGMCVYVCVSECRSR